MKFRTSSTLLIGSLLFLNACKGGGSSAPAGSEPAAGSAQTAASTGDANVTGTVAFSGAKPKASKISMGADAFCKTAHSSDVYSEEVVVNPNNTLKNVYVYVKKGLEGKTFAPSKEAVVLDQKGCMYTPHVVAVQVGQPLTVKNSDSVLHNVNARPKTNQGFNFGQPVAGMTSNKTFSAAEVMIPVKCDVHPWMGGWIGVQNHPFAAVTGDDGSFSLANLPAGTYEIEAWHEKFGTSVQTVTVGAKESKKLTFTFKGA